MRPWRSVAIEHPEWDMDGEQKTWAQWVDDELGPENGTTEMAEQSGKYPLPAELGDTSQVERRWLSMLLFSAREQIDMWGDVIETRSGCARRAHRRDPGRHRRVPGGAGLVPARLRDGGVMSWRRRWSGSSRRWPTPARSTGGSLYGVPDVFTGEDTTYGTVRQDGRGDPRPDWQTATEKGLAITLLAVIDDLERVLDERGP